MTDVALTRKFRGSTYRIRIQNKAGGEKGCVKVVVDGCAVKGGLIPADKSPAEHEVCVTIE